MSFDLGVWYPQERLANKEAAELYVRLCDGDTGSVVPNPAVDEFYAELTARYPEIDTIPRDKIRDYDYCPWSCKLDYSPAHVIMSCVWSKATDVGQLVENLARKHRLAMYDPQSAVVTYPDGSTGTKANRGALWILGSFALLFAAIFVYVGQISPSGSSLVFYVFAGLCAFLAVACFRQAHKSAENARNRSGKMSSTKIHWGRILLGGLLAEVALILAIVPLGLRLGGNFLQYTAPPGSFITCFLGALWVCRRIESRFILHGTLVGVVAALIYVALTRAQPEPFAYIVAHALKLVGGACGGFVAQRRRSPSLPQPAPD